MNSLSCVTIKCFTCIKSWELERGTNTALLHHVKQLLSAASLKYKTFLKPNCLDDNELNKHNHQPVCTGAPAILHMTDVTNHVCICNTPQCSKTRHFIFPRWFVTTVCDRDVSVQM